MKLKFVTFWLVVFGALFTFLQINFQYHFFYIEQSQLFLFSGMYLADKIVLPGGLALLLSEFLVQFFIAPYVGAAIVAALLTGVGMWTAGIVRRIAPSSDFFFYIYYRHWRCFLCILILIIWCRGRLPISCCSNPFIGMCE